MHSNSLGFSLGDELGFPESISTLEGNRRRSPKVDGINSEVVKMIIFVWNVSTHYKEMFFFIKQNSQALSKILQSRPKAVVSPQQMQQFEKSQNVCFFLLTFLTKTKLVS
jgi:hypothetical protein